MLPGVREPALEYQHRLGPTLQRICRYETTTENRLYEALHELERLQRLRGGDSVLDPITVSQYWVGDTDPICESSSIGLQGLRFGRGSSYDKQAL